MHSLNVTANPGAVEEGLLDLCANACVGGDVLPLIPIWQHPTVELQYGRDPSALYPGHPW